MESYQGVVKYLKCTVPAISYDTGIVDYQNLDSYFRGVYIRDKVILRVNLSTFFEEFFTKETISKYWVGILMIAKGLCTDPNQLSKVINDLIDKDDVFREKIRYIYLSCPDDVSFGQHIMNTLASVIVKVENEYRSFFRGKPSVVICTSDGYLYFSIEDKDTEPLLPYKVDCEVLSNVKSWRGKFTWL